MIPNQNNVYGTVSGRNVLRSIVDAARGMNCWNCVDLKENAYDEKLGLGSTTTQFESESLGENEHLLNGRVGGTPADVIDFVRKFSGELGKAGIAHHFEVYSAQEERLVESPLRAHL